MARRKDLEVDEVEGVGLTSSGRDPFHLLPQSLDAQGPASKPRLYDCPYYDRKATIVVIASKSDAQIMVGEEEA